MISVTGFAGSGIGYRRAHHDALLGGERAWAPRVLEIIPDHFFRDPDALGPLADAYALVFHDVALSLPTDGPPTDFERSRVRRIRDLCAAAKPLLFSDHLALTRSPAGIDVGHLAPVWLTHATLDRVSDRVSMLQDVLGVPIALENIATPFVLPDADMDEAEFFHALVKRTGCGLLMDLTNLLYNARNHGFDATARLRDYPLDAVVSVHLAGGQREHGRWVDSHSEAVEEESFSLLAQLRDAAPPLRAIIVERDERLPDAATLSSEALRAERIWREGM